MSRIDPAGRARRPSRASGGFPRLRACRGVRHLLVVLGDQLNARAAPLRRLDATSDAVLMLEVAGESRHVPSHKQRTALFLSAMRHFALELVRRGLRVHYVPLDDPSNTQSLDSELRRAVDELGPEQLHLVHPGEWRVMRLVEHWRRDLTIPIILHDDDHFLLQPAEFADWAAGRRRLVLEHFYRMMRRRHGILIRDDGEPEGGRWNYDADNRRPYRDGPPPASPIRFEPDAVTRDIIHLVSERLPDLPGRLDQFSWPVTRRAALRALRDFVTHRLPTFGPYQDAMVAGQPFLFHSLLSPALNLKLLDPREVIDAALVAWRHGRAPLQSVEGFVRQVLGWREFIRGVYWHAGPEYAAMNGLQQHGRLPEFYWTGRTDARCLKLCLEQVLDHGYGHHIQRLMVTGNFALIAGVHPRHISDWYLGMYVDAVDWVTLPNTLGMVMHADGGLVGTKPYAAGGRYIDKMSDYCRGCLFDPTQRTGPRACPFTTFYWDFLERNQRRLARNPRTSVVLQSLRRMREAEIDAIRAAARATRARMGIGPIEGGS